MEKLVRIIPPYARSLLFVYILSYTVYIAAEETCSRHCDDVRCTAGFVCPYRPQGDRAFCCGVAHQQFCCTLQEKRGAPELVVSAGNETSLNVLHVGVALAAVAVVLFVSILLTCLFCSCCPLYKRRHTDQEKTNGHMQNFETDQTDGMQVKGHENGISHVNLDPTHYYVNRLQTKDLMYHYLGDDRPSYEAGSQLSLAKPYSLAGSQYSIGQESTLSAGHTSLLSTSLSVGQSSMMSSAPSSRSQLFRPMSTSTAKENQGFNRGSVISLETNL